MAGIYNPWANPQTDETLTGMFATPDLMATGNPLSGGSAGGLDNPDDYGETDPTNSHEPSDPAADAAEDLSDPTEESEPDDMGGDTNDMQQTHMDMMSQAMSVIQSQNSVITQLLATLTAQA
jgi:hypothetical protein